MTKSIIVKPAVLTNSILITGMKENGIEVAKNSNNKLIYTACPRCTKKVISLDEAYTKDNVKDLPWFNRTPAIVFKNAKGNTLKACRCGYRELIIIAEKPKCPGCGSILKHEGDRCFGPNCTPPTQQERAVLEAEKEASDNQNAGHAPEVKQCNRKNCTNPVPPGRKAICYECQPPSNKEYSIEM